MVIEPQRGDAADLFHGTSVAAARSIIERGFRVWHDYGDHRYRASGNLGVGVYVTRRWPVALFFGPVVLRVRMRPGTRVLDASKQADPALLRSLKREFGRAILHQPPRKVLPHNKHLTQRELVAIVRHHYERGFLWFDASQKAEGDSQRNRALFWSLRSDLAQAGFHAVGDPGSDNGLVFADSDRLVVHRVLLHLPSDDHNQLLRTKWKELFHDECQLQLEDLQERFWPKDSGRLPDLDPVRWTPDGGTDARRRSPS